MVTLINDTLFAPIFTNGALSMSMTKVDDNIIHTITMVSDDKFKRC